MQDISLDPRIQLQESIIIQKMYRLKFVGKEKIGDIVDKSIAGIFMYC